MRKVFILLVFAYCIGGSPALAQDDLRFATVDIFLDSPEPVAAWQFELKDRHGVMKVVGVENGESNAFARAPYYDREALQQGETDRIVVADFSLADVADLPAGRVRIASLHLILSGGGGADANFDLDLIIAANHDGDEIDASIDIETNARNEP